MDFTVTVLRETIKLLQYNGIIELKPRILRLLRKTSLYWFDFTFTFAQNIVRGYTLELPH